VTRLSSRRLAPPAATWRTAGSARGQSGSFASSQPVKRPWTVARDMVGNGCRSFLPLRESVWHRATNPGKAKRCVRFSERKRHRVIGGLRPGETEFESAVELIAKCPFSPVTCRALVRDRPKTPGSRRKPAHIMPSR